MLRSVLLVSAFLLTGCATTLSDAACVRDRVESPWVAPALHASCDVLTGDAPPATFVQPVGEAPAAPVGSDFAGPRLGADPDARFLGLYAPQGAKGLRQHRFTIKGGYYGSTEDALDDGWIVNIAGTHFLNDWLAGEFEVGYFDAEGKDNGVKTDLWGVPTMLNARVNVPLWILDVYGGAGIGSIYYDGEVRGRSISVDVSGWVLAGNAFGGATVNVADRFALGLEVKYYVTSDIERSNDGLDAITVMLTAGFSL